MDDWNRSISLDPPRGFDRDHIFLSAVLELIINIILHFFSCLLGIMFRMYLSLCAATPKNADRELIATMRSEDTSLEAMINAMCFFHGGRSD